MKTLFSFLTVLLLSSFFCPTVHADFQKTKIAVLDFTPQGRSFDNEDIGVIVAEWLITAFVREGRFDVIERRLLDQLLAEQKMGATGLLSQDTASEIGKLLGVKSIISGSVVKIGDMVEVNARIIDVASASIIAAETVSTTKIISLHDLVEDLAKKIMKNFPLEGYVAHRNNNEIIIDLGRFAGAKIGMEFEVYREGQEIKHPKTGKVLYVAKIKTGTIKLISIYNDISTGTVVEEAENEHIAPGDQVKSAKGDERERQPKKVAAAVIPAPAPEPVRQPPATVNGKLFVDTVPADARIRILNIGPSFYQGMILSPDNYQVEVSAPGYQTETGWYQLASGENKRIMVTLPQLQQNEPPPVVATTKTNGRQQLAIFPWRPKTSSWFNIILDDIIDKIKSNPTLNLSHSYYDLYNQHSVQRIGPHQLNNRQAADLWAKSNFLSRPEPNVPKVVDMGKILGVDLVIMGRYNIKENGSMVYMDDFSIFIVNVHNGTMQKFSGSLTSNLYMGDYEIIKKTVNKAFRSFD